MTTIADRLREAGWGVMDAAHLINRTSSESVDVFVFFVLKSEDYDRIATWRSSLLSRSPAAADRLARAAWILLTEDVLYPNEKYVMRQVSWFDAVDHVFADEDGRAATASRARENSIV